MGFFSRLTQKRLGQSLPQQAHKTTAQNPQEITAEVPEASYVDVEEELINNQYADVDVDDLVTFDIDEHIKYS